MSPRRLSRSALGLAAGLTTAALLTTAQPAAAAPASAITAGSTYVALGSSFASGPGLPTVYDAACGRSTGNYAHRVAGALGLDLTDASCAGATSANVVSTAQATLQGPRPPQISALTAETDLVTVTVGGNDVNYSSDLLRNACVPPNDATVPDVVKPIVCVPVDQAATQAALESVTGKLVAMVEAIRQQAPHARIVLVDYLTILPQNGKPCAGLPLTEDGIRFSLDVARQLQLATKHAAQQAGAELVELSKASRSHDVCSADPWVSGLVWSDFFTKGILPFHPNAAGMQAAADLLVDHLR